MNNALIWPVLLQLLGIGVIIAEFILPTAGLLAMTAVGLFGFSLYLVFAKISVAAGMTFVVADLLLIPVLVTIGIKILAASPVTLKTSLDSKDGTVSQPEEYSVLTGAAGEALSNLRPAGTAMLNGKRVDVVSRGEFIEKGTFVTVINVDGNRIVVKRKEA